MVSAGTEIANFAALMVFPDENTVRDARSQHAAQAPCIRNGVGQDLLALIRPVHTRRADRATVFASIARPFRAERPPSDCSGVSGCSTAGLGPRVRGADVRLSARSAC